MPSTMTTGDLVRLKDSISKATQLRYERARRTLADEGLMTVEGQVLDSPDTEHLTIEGNPEDFTPEIPTLELYEFEDRIKTALGDLFKTIKDDPDEFYSFPFQNTIQKKIIKAVDVLEEKLVTAAIGQ